MKIRQLIYVIPLVFFLQNAFAEENHGTKEKEEFDLVEFAMHHIGDSYSWDFFTKQDGTKIHLPLPRILWNKRDNQLNVFLSTRKAIDKGYLEEHNYNHDAAHGKLIIPGSGEAFHQLTEAIEHETDTERLKALKAERSQLKPLDFSITKNVLFMLFAGILLLWVFIGIAKRYKGNPNSAPKGIQTFFEIIIVFIRDDIAKTYIPHKYERFLPLLLNFFFFIWFLNMMGLIPFSANVTGNIAITASLAIITMLVTNLNGKKGYWQHIFWYPEVPIPVKIILFIVELVSVFTKPFALAIRLFANITAGHLVILSFVSLIFIFGKLGAAQAAGWGTSVISVVFALFIDCIELLIALLQAYIFTTLSALFIGQAVEEH